MSEWIRIRVKDFYKDAVGELEYTYVTREVYEALADTFRKEAHADLCPQHIHLITDALLAETAETVEVLAHLAGSGAHHVGQLAGGDFLLAVGRQGRQVAVILGKTLDNGKRYLALNCHDTYLTMPGCECPERIPFAKFITYYKLRTSNCQFFI